MTYSTSTFMPGRVVERAASGVAAIALTALMLMASDARGAEQSESLAQPISVQYAPGDLDTTEGAANVYRKLKKAARRVCGIDGGFLNLPEKTRAQKCVDDTLADAVRQIDRPQLTSVHEAATSKVG